MHKSLRISYVLTFQMDRMYNLYIFIYMPGEKSITSDMQMIPPLWQKVKKN